MLGFGQHAPFGGIPFAPVGGATLGREAGLTGAGEKSLKWESYSVTRKMMRVHEIRSMLSGMEAGILCVIRRRSFSVFELHQ